MEKFLNVRLERNAIILREEEPDVARAEILRILEYKVPPPS